MQAARGTRLHHAWLIGGPRGIGKATLAYRFARWLLAAPASSEPPSLALDPAHLTYRRVAADTHADLLTVELGYDPVRKRQRTEITVDDVREVTAFLHRTPAEGGWRVVIVDGAEQMNTASSNALLKMLEEPPSRAVLLLVSHAPGALLPTLRSRCRALNLAPLGDAAMRAVLAVHRSDLTGSAVDRLIDLADGAPGRALMLAEEDAIGYAELAAEVLAHTSNLGLARRYSIADQVVRGEGGFTTFFDLLRRALAQSVREAARGAPQGVAAQLAAIRSLDGWSEIWQALGRLQHDTERAYLDKRQAVLDALRLLA